MHMCVCLYIDVCVYNRRTGKEAAGALGLVSAKSTWYHSNSRDNFTCGDTVLPSSKSSING